MEKRNVRVSFQKSGNGRGARITLFMPWLRKMGVSEEEREVVITYDEKKITLEKK
ncbi:hypothetical protein [Sebaldella termitidis]|uniref:hypothetical protein n=1 Tax=Sebaldella termitidis TaxID=826 RepID=UPI003EC0ED45